MRRLIDLRRWNLARRIFAMQAGVVLILVAAGLLGAYLHSSNTNKEAAEQRVLAVAHSVAAAPIVLDAIGSKDPSAALQPYAEQVGWCGTRSLPVASRITAVVAQRVTERQPAAKAGRRREANHRLVHFVRVNEELDPCAPLDRSP